MHPFVLAPVPGTDAANPSQFRLRSGYYRNVDHAKSSPPDAPFHRASVIERTVVLVLSEAVLVLDYGSERANAMGSKVDSAARPDRSLPIRVRVRVPAYGLSTSTIGSKKSNARTVAISRHERMGHYRPKMLLSARLHGVVIGCSGDPLTTRRRHPIRAS